MKLKNLIRLLCLISLVIVLIGCGKKAPPSLPKKPSSLIRIEQKVQLLQCHLFSIKKDLFAYPVESALGRSRMIRP
jgi:predicted small lipoprotein YifL